MYFQHAYALKTTRNEDDKMPKFVSEEAESLLKEMLETSNVKKLIDDKFTSYEQDPESDSRLRAAIDELVENHLMMCTWYADTVHEAKIPISAEQYFEEKEKYLKEEEERLKEEERLAEEARLLEAAKIEQALRAEQEKLKKEAERKEKLRIEKEEKLREESRQREAARLAEIEKLQEQMRKADEIKQKEIEKLHEEARIADEARQKEIVRLQEQIKKAEEERQKEQARIREEDILREEIKRKEAAKAEEEIRIKEAELLKNAAELYAEAGINASTTGINEAALSGFGFDITASLGEMIIKAKEQINSSNAADKNHLFALLEEAVEIVDEINTTRRIPKRKRYFNELSELAPTHGWFTSAMAGIIGKACWELLAE